MKDFLIVGFGLAGLSIAKHLESSNSKFDIVSDTSQLSSRIAGGILNPIAVKRMKPAWRVEEFLPYAKTFYQSLNKEFPKNIFQNKTLQVFIHDIEQENNWYQANDKARLNPYISSEIYRNKNQNLNIETLGQIKAASIDLTHLFQYSKLYFQKQLIDETFKYDELIINDGYISYYKRSYKHVVFCEGYGVSQNPFFNNLGIYGNKGDYLIFESKELQLQDIYKAKYFLIPLGNNLYKFGATYQRQPLNHHPSSTAKTQMIEALKKMINVPFKIINQVCGIRPTTKDRRPVVGTHKNFKNLHLINGFGSRGVMMSPRLGQMLVSHILENKPLDPEVSIDRFDAQTQVCN